MWLVVVLLMCTELAVVFSGYGGPVGKGVGVLLGAIGMAIGLRLLFVGMWQAKQRMYDRLAEYLEKRGWETGLGVPENASAALLATRFNVYAPMFDYTCTHVRRANGAMLYLAVGKSGDGRTADADTVIVATGDLRAPVECLVAIDSLTREGAQSGLQMTILRSRANKGPDLYVYFEGGRSGDDPRVVKAVRIAGLIFDGAESALAPASVAVLGPHGMVIRGPVLDVEKKVEPIVEPLVRGAEHLLDRCERVWAENRDGGVVGEATNA
jgi:hypothetical protein